MCGEGSRERSASARRWLLMLSPAMHTFWQAMLYNRFDRLSAPGVLRFKGVDYSLVSQEEPFELQSFLLYRALKYEQHAEL